MKFLALLMSLTFAFSASAEKVTDAQKAAAQKHIDAIKKWAADPKFVELVKKANANPPGKDLDQKKWDDLKVLDPVVVAFTKNEAAEFMKKNKTDVMTEAFLNTAEGTKIAFLSKTSGWSHKGKAKHDVPMTGKDWIMSEVEKDDSTGLLQFQIAVPVMDGGKAIGSLVVGLAVAKL